MIISKKLTLRTQGDGHAVDVTPGVEQVIHESQLKSGVVTLFVVGSTAALTTIEYEPGALADLKRAFEVIAPRDQDYQHHLRWHDDNGHSHVRAALLGPSLSVPFVGGELTLGTWQQIILIDFDTRPRTREVVAQIVGE
jgi:secondary thiamine-phosphate synthase enzyme